ALRLRLDAGRRLRRQAAALTRLGARPDPQPALDPQDQGLVEALRRLPPASHARTAGCWCCPTAWTARSRMSAPPSASPPPPSRPAWPGAGPCSPACSRRRPTNANKEHPTPGTDLGDRLDHLLRTVEAGVTAANPAAVTRRGPRP